jgi:hypothetical protein
MMLGGMFSSIRPRAPSGRALGVLAVAVMATSICGAELAQAFNAAAVRVTVPTIHPTITRPNVGINVIGVTAGVATAGARTGASTGSGGNGATDKGTWNRRTARGTRFVPPSGPPPSGPNRPIGRGGPPVVPLVVPPTGAPNYVPDEVIIEVAGTPTDRTFNALAARHRLTRLETQPIALTGSTWVRWRIAGGRAVPAVVRALEADATVRSAQPNYVYALEQDDTVGVQKGDPHDSLKDSPQALPQDRAQDPPPAAAPTDLQSEQQQGGDPAQYALVKLHLPEAQAMARGDSIVVAVIDTEIDRSNPELAGAIVEAFDALGETTPMEAHGTGIAGIIAAHARLLGAAPNVRILAVRAFGAGRGTTFTVMKGLDWAVAHDAKVLNMSFAGPADPAMARIMTATHDRGRILIAAAGNKGPKSPPLFPAADPHVIAVTATDADDKLFALANRGDYVAVAAPGVDILVAAPEGVYLMSSGTSFASAYVSGIAALLVEKKPDLSPDAARRVLMSTARHLGPKERDDQFGAGLIDANQALLAVSGRPEAEMPLAVSR